MKHIQLNILAALCLLMAFACHKGSTEEEHHEPAGLSYEASSTAVHTPLAVAAANTHRYDSICAIVLKKAGVDSVPIRAYTIRATDLLEVMGMPISDSAKCKYNYARVYLGLDADHHFKLYFTPVKGADLISMPQRAGSDVILRDPEGDPGSEYVLDLNAPSLIPAILKARFTKRTYESIQADHHRLTPADLCIGRLRPCHLQAAEG